MQNIQSYVTLGYGDLQVGDVVNNGWKNNEEVQFKVLSIETSHELHYQSGMKYSPNISELKIEVLMEKVHGTPYEGNRVGDTTIFYQNQNRSLGNMSFIIRNEDEIYQLMFPEPVYGSVGYIYSDVKDELKFTEINGKFHYRFQELNDVSLIMRALNNWMENTQNDLSLETEGQKPKDERNILKVSRILKKFNPKILDQVFSSTQKQLLCSILNMHQNQYSYDIRRNDTEYKMYPNTYGKHGCPFTYPEMRKLRAFRESF